MLRQLRLVSLFLVLSFPVVAVSGAIHVPTDWPTIAEAVAVATLGDTIYVAPGTYYEDSIVLADGVVLTSETGDPLSVTVNARFQGRVFECETIGSSTAVIGMTLTGGYSSGSGGAVYLSNASPQFLDCVFRSNVAQSGGAVFCFNGADSHFEDCVFTSNEAENGSGGAVYVQHYADPTFSGCVFDDNDASHYGGAFYSYWWSNPVLTDCDFTGNTAGNSGGALSFHNISSPIVTRCSVVGNTAGQNGAAGIVIVELYA